VDSVGYTLYSHVVQQINALYSTLVLVLTLVVEARHGVIEVSHVCKAGFISSLHILELSLSMCN
jgi:hypothetical protein